MTSRSFNALVLAITVALTPATAAGQDQRPYDERLLRLTEVLGSIHYLRELCGANEGQLWRDRMRELLDADTPSALRRARLTRSFNTGYRNFSRTYTSCTPTAQTTAAKFLTEAAQIADNLVRTVP